MANPAGEKGIRQLEQLLTHHIGPMAKVLVARSLGTARDDAELVRLLANQLDEEGERAAFVAAAGRALAANPVILPDQAATAPPAPSSAPEAPRTAPPQRHAGSAGDAAAMKAGAIFVSYARDDIAVARRIEQALVAAGLDVWLDLGELQAGDAWDLKIRRNIEACSFFLPLISRTTETRQEGYFRREWNIAADRALNFADDVPFIVPIAVDDTAAYSARVPERFRRAQWISAPQGEVTPEVVERLKALMEGHRAGRP